MPTSTISLCACESSQVARHGYDPMTQTMALTFKNKSGETTPYHYANVTQEQYDDFLAAESKGKWFGANLKRETEKHPFTKMVPDEKAAA